MPLTLLKPLGLTSDEAFSFLWKNMKVGACIVGENREILAVNPHFCHLLEYSESELVTKKFDDILLPLDLYYDLKMIQKLKVDDIEEYEMYQTYVTKTQKLTKLQLTVTPLKNKDGNLLYFYSQIAEYNDQKYEPAPVPVQIKEQELTWIRWLYEHSWKIILVILGFIGWLWQKSVEVETLKYQMNYRQETQVEPDNNKSTDITNKAIN